MNASRRPVPENPAKYPPVERNATEHRRRQARPMKSTRRSRHENSDTRPIEVRLQLTGERHAVRPRWGGPQLIEIE